jgi:hypothetical protein
VIRAGSWLTWHDTRAGAKEIGCRCADFAFQRHRLDLNTPGRRRLSLDQKHDHAPLHLHARVSTGLACVLSSNGNSMEQRRIIDKRCKHPDARDQGRDMSPVVLMPVSGAFRVDC